MSESTASDRNKTKITFLEKLTVDCGANHILEPIKSTA